MTALSATETLHAVFDSLTEWQRDVLGSVAINMDGGHHPKTLAKLVSLGLIEEAEQVLPGRFPVTIKRYEMPIGVHIAWCAWCDENFDEAGNRTARPSRHVARSDNG